MPGKSLILLFLLISLVSSCKIDKNLEDPGLSLGALVISKQKPQPGDHLNLIYKGIVPGELDSARVEGYAHYWVGPNAYPEDIEFSNSSGVWKAKIVLPDTATAATFYISKNGKIDNNNKKGFILPLYNTRGEILAGSRASQGFFYTYYGSLYEVQNDSAFVMLENDLVKHPELIKDWDIMYARLLDSRDKERAKAHIEHRIKELGGRENPEEEELMVVHGLFELLKKKKSADSLGRIIAQKFPKSLVVKQKYLQDLQKAKSVGEKEKILEEFSRVFGLNEKGYEKNYMIQLLLRAYAEEENWKKFDHFSQLMTMKDRQAAFYNSTAWNMAQNEKNLEKAAELSKVSLELLEQEKKPPYLTKKQFEKSQKDFERMYLETYAYILVKQGKIEEAIECQKKAVGEGINSDSNERYIQLLLKGGHSEIALKTAAEYISKNTATSETKKAFKEAYMITNESLKGFQQKLAELEKIGKNKAIAEIKKEMMDEVAPDFKLKDVQGNEVSLASFEGKTIILDFWATWCGPCVKSFPAMKKAVEQYQDNPEVKFLFINSLEYSPTREKDVADFISLNNYPFHVLFDKAVDDFYNFQTSQEYSIFEIPAKIIIDPAGKIRFKKVGYSGNNEQMLQELDIMIDLATQKVKKEGKLIAKT